MNIHDLVHFDSEFISFTGPNKARYEATGFVINTKKQFSCTYEIEFADYDMLFQTFYDAVLDQLDLRTTVTVDPDPDKTAEDEINAFLDAQNNG